MQDKESPTFKIGDPDDVHDEMLHNELQELKIEKLSQRVTLLTILIPCMIGIILVIAYLDIKDRVTLTQDTGTIGVQKLAKDIESKFSSLSLEQAKINDILSKLPNLENSSAFVQSRLKKMEQSLDQLQTSSVNRDELTRVVQNVNEKTNQVQTTLKAGIEKLEAADRELSAATRKSLENLPSVEKSLVELKDRLSRIETGIQALGANLQAMDDSKIGKEELDFNLRLKEMASKQSLLDATRRLEKKILSLEEAFRSLQAGSAEPADAAGTAEPATGAAQESKKDASASASASDNQESAAKPDTGGGPPETIVEQNLE